MVAMAGFAQDEAAGSPPMVDDVAAINAWAQVGAGPHAAHRAARCDICVRSGGRCLDLPLSALLDRSCASR
jgi:hypothetical protein